MLKNMISGEQELVGRKDAASRILK